MLAIVKEVGAVAQSALHALRNHGQGGRWQTGHGLDSWRLGLQDLPRAHVPGEGDVLSVL